MMESPARRLADERTVADAVARSASATTRIRRGVLAPHAARQGRCSAHMLRLRPAEGEQPRVTGYWITVPLNLRLYTSVFVLIVPVSLLVPFTFL